MTAATLAETRLTSDPVPPEKLHADTDALFAALNAGGIGIVPRTRPFWEFTTVTVEWAAVPVST